MRRALCFLTLIHIAASSSAAPVTITLTNGDYSLAIPTELGSPATADYRLGFRIESESDAFGLGEFSLTNRVRNMDGTYWLDWTAVGDISSLPGTVSVSAEIFREGTQISSSTIWTNSTLVWFQHRRANSASLTAQAGTNNFLAILLRDAQGMPHYGYVQYELRDGDFSAGAVSILGGALNSDPYTPLVTGIPEPSTYALLLMTGAGALCWARRRR